MLGRVRKEGTEDDICPPAFFGSMGSTRGHGGSQAGAGLPVPAWACWRYQAGEWQALVFTHPHIQISRSLPLEMRVHRNEDMWAVKGLRCCVCSPLFCSVCYTVLCCYEIMPEVQS